MHRVIVIGGGASGMLSAIFSSMSGNEVTIIEKNEKLGKKIYITGKGRCNLTNAVDSMTFINNVVKNPKFVYSALNAFSPFDLMDFMRSNGLELKTERGNRVFPVSDKASDVTKTLSKILEKQNVKVILNRNVTGLEIKNGKITGVSTECGTMCADSVIVCTGGFSYSLTGSTGDGYIFAKNLGHSIVKCKPSLVGIEVKQNDYLEMQGLSLKNVSIKALIDGKEKFSDFGEMLFTHYGLSGPIVLSCSAVINAFTDKKITLSLDLKPALSIETLDNRLLREFKDNSSKSIFNVMRALLPQSMINPVLTRANVSKNKNCSEIKKEERESIIKTLKNFNYDFKCLRPIEEAIVTSGGVNVNEINPKTMESKIISGLFFAGEVIDVDAFTGGFNLQLAFSTGYLAGKNS